ncbi:MAG: hypothetical protein JXR52_06135 [Bacteroidales bacterium]|nr:hypothetical protein [Bacteroidales bacterium]MBN2698386.1 hypothetical protein [Bacteroidales bacterium]
MKNFIAKRLLFIIIAAIFGYSLALSAESNLLQSRNYTGTYTLVSGDVTLTLTLQQDANNNLTGFLKSSNGNSFTIEGMVSEGVATGVCKGNEGGLYIEAYLDGNELTLSLIEPDSYNMPDYNTAQYLVLNRTIRQAEPAPGSISPVQQFTQSPDRPGQPSAHSGTQAPMTGQAVPRSASGSSTLPPSTQTSKLGNEEAGDELLGYKFRKPATWNHQNEAGYILLGSTTIPGLIIVFPHQSNDIRELISEMHKGLQEEGISLTLTGQVKQQSGTTANAYYQGVVQGEQARGYGIGLLNPNGSGIFILAVSTPDKLGNEIIAAANTICQNTTFFKLRAGDPTLVKHFSGEWAWTNGYRTEWMTFYPDGTYTDQYEAGYSGDFTDGGGNITGNWGASAQDSNRGRWTVQGTKDAGVITVLKSNGDQIRYDYRVYVERGEKFYWEYLFNNYHYRKQKAL